MILARFHCRIDPTALSRTPRNLDDFAFPYTTLFRLSFSGAELASFGFELGEGALERGMVLLLDLVSLESLNDKEVRRSGGQEVRMSELETAG